jgi:hypothetical protein
MIIMLFTGRLLGKIQPKYLIAAGAVIIALSMYRLTNVYGDLGFWFLACARLLFGIGLPLIFVSITTASYDGLSPDKTGQAAALINAARNTGVDRRLPRFERIIASRAISSEPTRRKHHPLESPILGYAAADYELLH